jgi:hypothetical protein
MQQGQHCTDDVHECIGHEKEVVNNCRDVIHAADEKRRGRDHHCEDLPESGIRGEGEIELAHALKGSRDFVR